MKGCKIKEKLWRYGNGALKALLAAYGVYASAILTTTAVNAVLPTPKKTLVLTGRLVENNLTETVVTYTNYLFLYLPVTIKENLQGFKTVWVHDAPKSEALELIADEAYDNVVLIGHGSSSRYEVADGAVTSIDILKRGIKKQGRLLQYTCGSDTGLPLGEVMLSDPSNWLHFDEDKRLVSIYLAAWGNLFR